MLFYFLHQSRKIKRIKIVFLLPGHTYMPVDSIHATIERFIKRRTVWAPSEWETIIGNARTNPSNLETIKLHFEDFLDWKSISNGMLGCKKLASVDGGLIKMTQVRSVLIEKNNPNIIIDYSYDGTDLKVVRIGGPKKYLKNKKIKRLYNQSLCIAPQKKEKFRRSL